MEDKLKSIGINNDNCRTLIILIVLIIPLALCVIIGFLGTCYKGSWIRPLWVGFVEHGGTIYIFVYFIIFAAIFVATSSKRYWPCPYCDKSVLIKTDWQCPYCNNYQGEARFICDTCKHCKRKLETAFCEHCHEEFKL